MKYGKLECLDKIIIKQRSHWNCVCDCGNRVTVSDYSLKSGNSTSCGCNRIKKLQESCKKTVNIGDTFGKLTITEIMDATLVRDIKYNCSCECGNTKIILHSRIISGKLNSCGCLLYSEASLDKRRKTCTEKYGSTNYLTSEHFTSTGKYNKSKGEQDLNNFIQSLGFPTVKKYIKDGRKYELDIFIEEKNIALEYNGLWFHSEQYVAKNYHNEKRIACTKLNINLIQIFEDEWRERKEQVKGFLRNKLGICVQKLSARKLEFKEVDNNEARIFSEKYHIQGAPSSAGNKSWGAYHNGELVLLVIFGDHHRNNKDVSLKRLISKDGVIVRGGLSKIMKIAYEYYKSPIVTWVDRRFSEGNSYLKAGFTQDSVLKPDYFYINSKHGSSNCKKISKQSRQKKKCNTPDGMTESEHARLDGLFKIWDCGKIRFVYNPNNL